MAAFYLDEDVSPRLARFLIERGHHVATTDDEGRKGAPDARQLLHAAARGWILLTGNAYHYRLLHDAWLMWSRAWGYSGRHAGIVIVPHVVAADLPRIGEAIHRLVSDPGITLAAALHGLTPEMEWKRWPR